VYYSLMVKVTDLAGASTSGVFVAGFSNSAATATSSISQAGTRLQIRANPTDPGKFNLGIRNDNFGADRNSPIVWDTTDFAPGPDSGVVFVVAAYAFNSATNTDDVASLWINPDPATFGAPGPPPPTVTSTGADISQLQMQSFFLRQNDGAPQTMIVDELRIGTTWGDVTTPTLDKGHRIIQERGLQLQGLVITYDLFHLDTFQAANYTTCNWLWDSYMPWLGAAPGIPWSRWASREADMPPNAQEAPYAANLVAISLGDEQDLNDPVVRAATAQWYANVRDRYPNTILYCNSWGGQITNPNLDDFIRTSRPDMLSFDTYPFRPGEPTGGSPTNFYGDLQRYRKFALGYGIPYGMYTQTFHDSATRDPSESEMRLDYFAGLAFGYTYFNTFVYNMGATSLFSGPGDTNPKPAYSQLAEIQRRARNLGPAVTHLLSTDVRFINGKHRDASSGATVSNPTPVDVLNWQFAVNDPYLRGWVITNVGTKNDGLPGDVWLSWFKPLEEAYDGPTCNGEIYMMVVNGLTAPDGSAADCRQEIRLNFLFSSGFGGVQRLNHDTGRLELLDAPIIPNSGGRRQLTLLLDGGTGDLFKFKTGAPFVGLPDLDPPGPVSNVMAQGTAERIILTWSNPTDCDFSGTLIRRKMGDYPADIHDGQFVADRLNNPGSLDSLVDTGLTNGVAYCYAAFAHDGRFNYATAATAAGVPGVYGDFDLDGDTDLADFTHLQVCFNGPNRPYAATGCSDTDLDHDNDVDLGDFQAFQGCFNGPNRPPGCR
jgi:hypothetical protein